MEQLKVLGVYFRGSRDYVQGSLITSLALDAVAQHFQGVPVGVKRARFKSIQTQAVGLVSQLPKDMDTFGDMVCAVGEGKEKFYLVEIEGDELERREDRLSQIVHYENRGHMACAVKIRHPQTFDDIMSAIVETVKRCVTTSFEGAQDVWFTEMAGANLQEADFELCHDDIGLFVESDGELIRGDRVLTRASVTIDFGNDNRRSAKIGFTHLEKAK